MMSVPHAQPCFIDVEASGLGRGSYPIEIAWSMPDGSIESHLINPAFIPHWTHWDDYAEETIHRISRDLLAREGKSPVWVAQRMNTCLDGITLHSDAVDFDDDWVSTLFKAARVEPAFWIIGIETLWASPCIRQVIAADLEQCSQTGAASILQACHDAALVVAPRTHRAADDVRHMQVWHAKVIQS